MVLCAHSDFSPSQTAVPLRFLSLPFPCYEPDFTFLRPSILGASFATPSTFSFSPSRPLALAHRIINPFRLASNATTLKGFFGCVGHRVGYLAFCTKRRTFTQDLLAVTRPFIMSSSDDDMPLARGNKSNGLSNGTNGTFSLSFIGA